MRRLARDADELVAGGAASFSEFSALMMENTRLGVEERIARLSAFCKRHADNAAPKRERAKRSGSCLPGSTPRPRR